MSPKSVDLATPAEENKPEKAFKERRPPAPKRASLTVEEVGSMASERAGYEVPMADVALKVMQTDLDALYDEASARVEWAVWDKETPINDVAPEVVLARPDFAGGEIYLIWIDGHLSILQPHAPAADAPLWADEVEEVAALHAAELVDGFVWDLVAETIAEDSTPPAPTFTMEEIREALGSDDRPIRRRQD